MSTDPAASGDPSLALEADHAAILRALEGSALGARILGPEILEGVVAVRRHEADALAERTGEQIAEALRFAWSS